MLSNHYLTLSAVACIISVRKGRVLNKKANFTKANFVFEELEPRLLLSADGLGVITESSVATVQALVHGENENIIIIQQQTEQPSTVIQNKVHTDSRSELVIIDSRAPNFQQLHNDVIKAQQQGRDINVVILDAHRDGIEQISEALSKYNKLDAVHIVSHGKDAQLQLGATQLDNKNLKKYSDEINKWMQVFTEGGDLLIYGCNLAGTPNGISLVNSLSGLTGTDVAASDDVTGNSVLGGDWDLEYQTGDIETKIAFTADVQDNWQGTLNADALAEQQAAEAEQQQEEQIQAEQETALIAESEAVLLAEEKEAEVITQEPEQQAGIVEEQRLEIVFIDESVNDYQTFIDDLNNNNDGSINFEVVLLDNDRDGIEQISETLSAYGDVDAMHVVSHGNDGTVKLGNTWLQLNNLNQYSDSINSWSEALDENADLLIYGCNLAQSEQGEKFIDELAQLTGADVAASDDLTGNVSLGGDWDLEYKSGEIETTTAISDEVQKEWSSVLTSVSLVAAQDTYIHRDFGDTNYGSSTSLLLDKSGGDNGDGRLLLDFDISSIPAGATITGASFTMEATQNDGLVEIKAFELTESWDGNSATWNNSESIAYDTTAVDTLTTAATGQHSWDLTSLVQSWYDGSKVNNGILIASTEVGTTTVTYDSSENAIAPKLIITYNLANVFTVSNINDSGAGSLRQAIIDANAQTNSGSPDIISFDIPDALVGGAHTITLSSLLPDITEAVIINGSSEPDFATNPVVVIDGNGLSGDGLVLTSGASGSTISGLVIRDFTNNAIQINSGSDNNTITGNYLGQFNADGTDAGVGENFGAAVIYIAGANNTIGGTTAADRNLISGGVNGIVISGATATNNTISGNYIGTDITGSTIVGNTFDGIRIENGAINNTVGGATSAHGNVITGNGQDGVQINGENSDGNTIQNNLIGTVADQSSAPGNGGDGIYISGGADNTLVLDNHIAGNTWIGVEIDGDTSGSIIQGNIIGTDTTGTLNWGHQENGILIENGGFNNLIGGTGAGEGNVIAFNGQGGSWDDNIAITQTAGTGNSILGNSIYSGVGLGIDLGANDGVTANDVGDGDTGANNLQNFPVLTSSNTSGGDTTIVGTFNSNTSTNYRIEFFSSATGDGTGYGEAETYLGFVNVTTDGSGNATINTVLTGVAVTSGHQVTATATVDLGGGNYGDTSEFSQNIQATVNTVTFQQGTDGYTGTQDTYTDENFTTNNNGSLIEVAVDLDDGAGDATTQGLIRFDDIFGVGAGQIPVGATINSAELTVYVTNVSNGAAQVTLHSMLMDWNEASTWDSTVNGVSTDDVEASSAIDSTLASPDNLGSQTFTGLAAVLQAWSDGAANYGWVITTDNDNGWDFASSENGTVSFRPVLTVDYTIAVNNNAPVNTVPGAQVTNEDTAIIFNAANSNLISISDDAGEVLTTTISVNNGVLTLSQMTGLTFDAGANGTATMTVTGTLEDINSALDGMQYDPASDYNGGDTLTITANDAELLALNLDSNLQGYYALDSADPTGDSGPNSAPAGVLNGDAFIATETARGDVLSLDGTNDYVQIGDDFGIDSGTFTLALWVNLDASATPATVINVGARAEIRLDETVLGLGVFAAYNDGGAPWKQTTTGTFLAGTGWHHVAYTVDGAGNEQVVYIDGVAITTTNHTASILSGSSGITNIGVNGAISYDFAGQIDDTRIYGRALSASDIATLASAPLNVSDTDTVAIAISAVNDAPVADAGGPYNISEGGGVTLDASGSSDPDSDPMTYSWDLNNDSTYGDATGVSPTLTWAQLQAFGINDDGTYTINVEVDDGNGGITTDTTTIDVVNVAPTLTVTGNATIADGSTYTLNLSDIDAGADTITSWTIDWGDGNIVTYAGDPTSVTHVYTGEGLTFNISVSATDEDGSYLTNEMLVASANTNSIFRYEPNTGAFLDEFGTVGEGVNFPASVTIGPDGYLYVASYVSDDITRYDATTGAFVDIFISNAIGTPNYLEGISFGSNGNIFVSNLLNNSVLEFDSGTGALVGTFISSGSGGVSVPSKPYFHTDGNVYVASKLTNEVLQYDGTTGAFLGVFVSSGSGGLSGPKDLTFGPDGNLYVASQTSDSVLRYNGTTGAYIDTFITTASGGLDGPRSLDFAPDGYLYVSSEVTDNVKRYNATTGAYVDDFFAPNSGGIDRPFSITFVPSHQVTVTATSDSIAIANNDSYNTNENTALIFDPTTNDTDADSDAISVVEFTQPTNGTVVDNGDGTLTYTPDGGYTGADSFDYVAIDTGAGLQNYWGLDGDAVDAIGGADGTLNGTTTVAGDVGNALSFNETTDYALLPDVTYASEYSISFDFKIDDNTGSLFQYIYSHGDINTTNSINIFLNEATHATDPNKLRTVVRDC